MRKLITLLLICSAYFAHAQVDSGQYTTLMYVGNALNYKVPTSRTVTINGNTQNMWSDLNFTISGTAYTAGYGLSLASNVFKSDSTANLSVASFNQRRPNQLSKTANYTILTSDFGAGKEPILHIWFDCTSGNITGTIPTASNCPQCVIVIGKSDASTNVLTISGLSADNKIGTQLWAKELYSNGTIWVQN